MIYINYNSLNIEYLTMDNNVVIGLVLVLVLVLVWYYYTYMQEENKSGFASEEVAAAQEAQSAEQWYVDQLDPGYGGYQSFDIDADGVNGNRSNYDEQSGGADYEVDESYNEYASNVFKEEAAAAEEAKRQSGGAESFTASNYDGVAPDFETMATKLALGDDMKKLERDQSEWAGQAAMTRAGMPLMEVNQDVNVRIGLNRTNYAAIPNLKNQNTVPSLYNEQLYSTDNYNIMGAPQW